MGLSGVDPPDESHGRNKVLQGVVKGQRPKDQDAFRQETFGDHLRFVCCCQSGNWRNHSNYTWTLFRHACMYGPVIAAK